MNAVRAAREAARVKETGRFGLQPHTAPSGDFLLLDDTSWMDEDFADIDIVELDTITVEVEVAPEPDPDPRTESQRALQDSVAAAIPVLGDRAAPAEQKEVIVREVGALVVARAEELAGISVAEVVEADQAERDDAQETFDRLKAQIEEVSARQRANHTEYRDTRRQIDSATGAEKDELIARADQLLNDREAILREFDVVTGPFQEASRIVAGVPTPQRLKNTKRLSDGYLAAISEVRDMSQQHTEFHKNTQPRARVAFQEASDYFPKDWVDASNEAGPMMGRLRKDRAHYSHNNSVQKTERVPVYFRSQDESDDRITLPSGEAPPADNVRPIPSYRWGGRYSRHCGTMWHRDSVQDDGQVAWRKVAAEGPANKRYRGVLENRALKPPGDGWEWVDRSDPNRPESGFWVRPEMRNKVVESESLAEIKTSASTPAMDGASATLATSVHELVHRTEYTVSGVTQMEKVFLNRRWEEAGVAEHPLRRIYPSVRGNDEVGRDAGFVNPYVGKVYRTSAATEVLSVGAESVFAGSFGGLVGLGRHTPDHDHRDFVLGMFAAFGHRDAK